MSQLPEIIEKSSFQVIKDFGDKMTCPWILVDSNSQSMFVMDNKSLVCKYLVSTSKYGMGCEQNSFKTPVGAHKIAKKIGYEGKLNEIFVGRVATGQNAIITSEKKPTDSDLILTRILWLQGLEKNKNCGEGVDSFERYIYIHGTQEEGLLGSTASHGCVRMANADIVELFNSIDEGAFVYIQ